VAETQAGKGALPWDHPALVDSIGVTGSSAANALAKEADVVLAVGTRLADFATGSWALFENPNFKLVSLNVTHFDVGKHRGLPLVSDARRGLEDLSQKLGSWRAPSEWTVKSGTAMREWIRIVDRVTAASDSALPTDAQVVGAVNRTAGPDSVVVCAAGGLPAELQKLWRTVQPGGYHVEYGYSCMGYEIAGALGVKMAFPEREVYVMVGDGSYLMMNSEIASAVTLGCKLILVVLDNRGYGCINRLQQECGSAPFNNLLKDVCGSEDGVVHAVDFAKHAESLGAVSEKVTGIGQLNAALGRARASKQTYAIVIDTDPAATTVEGGAWWDVVVPEVSSRPEVQTARAKYELSKARQRV
jgi:3D-(3,5/4)-trihydroxycyclohexane-1,2-dione acylhydrolase (decyclizing)